MKGPRDGTSTLQGRRVVRGQRVTSLVDLVRSLLDPDDDPAVLHCDELAAGLLYHLPGLQIRSRCSFPSSSVARKLPFCSITTHIPHSLSRNITGSHLCGTASDEQKPHRSKGSGSVMIPKAIDGGILRPRLNGGHSESVAASGDGRRLEPRPPGPCSPRRSRPASWPWSRPPRGARNSRGLTGEIGASPSVAAGLFEHSPQKFVTVRI